MTSRMPTTGSKSASERGTLLLLSPDFMASEFCYDVEMKKALERHEACYTDHELIPSF